MPNSRLPPNARNPDRVLTRVAVQQPAAPRTPALLSLEARYKIALALTYMIFAVLLNSVGTVILQVMQSFHISKLDASLLEAFKDLSIAAASFALASFLPAFGYRRSMICALTLVALACVTMRAVPGFHTTEILFGAVGVSFAITKISLYASLGLLTQGRAEHARLTNLVEGMFMLGTLCGYWIFSAFIDANASSALGWLNVYWVLAAICVVAIGLLASSPLDEGAARSAPARSMRAALHDLRSVAARPLVLVFLLSAFLYVLIEQSVGTWLPTFNRETLRLPNVMSVQLASLFAGMLAIGRLGAGLLLRRVGWYVLLNTCIAIMAILILWTLPLAATVRPSAHPGWFTLPAPAYLVPLFGLFMAPIYPVINSVAISALPQRMHATMAGLIVVFSALGGASGSRVTAIVFGRFGGQRAFYFSLIPIVLMLAMLYLFKQQVEQSRDGVADSPRPPERRHKTPNLS